MSGSNSRNDPRSSDSLAKAVFSDMKPDDPIFLRLKGLLLHGRRSEAINLILEHDGRFQDTQAQELVRLIMNTLRDTVIDP